MGISAWQIIVLLLIVVLLFGTKKLRNIGGDLGEAIKGFKSGMKDDETQKTLKHEPGASEETLRSSFAKDKSN